jgi:hypothetical protein
LIPKFSGTDDVTVEEFTEAVSIAASLSNWSDVQTRAIARLRLHGAAMDHIRASEATANLSWSHMRDLLKKRFRPRGLRHLLEQKFIRCVQQRGEKVGEYATRLRLIGRQIAQSLLDLPQSAAGETSESITGQLFHQFVNGLRPEIKRFVLVRNPGDLESAIECAQIEEANEPFSRMDAALAQVEAHPEMPPENPPARPNNPQAPRPQGTRYFRSSNRGPGRANFRSFGRGRGRASPNGSCFGCGQTGHFSNECPLVLCGVCFNMVIVLVTVLLL